MKIHGRSFMRRLTTLAAAALLALTTSWSHAQEFPTKPITLIVPFPAGGSTDQLMRALGDAASKHLGQPVIIDNRTGGGGAIGPGTMAMTAKPDGYTIAQIPIPVYRLPMMQKTSWSARRLQLHHPPDRLYLHAGRRKPDRLQEVAGRRRLRQGKSRQGDVRHLRDRRDPASRHRNDRGKGRHQADPCAVQGRGRS